MDEVFKALADPSRRQLLDRLHARNGQSLGELGDGLGMSRQAVTKHLVVLAEANLVTAVRDGRRRLHYLNPVPINEIAQRWIGKYDRDRLTALADLKRTLEEPVSAPEFVYVTYIRTTDRKLWQALTDPAFTERYWGAAFESDWRPGSPMVWHQQGWSSSDPEQVVLEAEPYTRLSYTWHTFDPAFAEAFGMDSGEVAAWGQETRSKVTFELEPQGEVVKLTVVHDGFEPGSAVLEGISTGWPNIIASLKTLLETGDTLPQPVG
ncbi:ArsR/SmtB family transcription factor [Nocardia jinanensis]|uniref:ArsR family transcriptional regulator n=1 Tax=Nocardia jinanensis TaxID=382504 RepID=A0A917RF89_9NOCA|nr:metalloregulator ArsR/SmtB family transcription factor [Nocardia jinanensis]GGL05074.1 ArsR family transcriptional regulator [Nocardia jinanensis]